MKKIITIFILSFLITFSVFSQETGTNDFRISDMGIDGDNDYDANTPAIAFNATDNQYLVVWQGEDNPENEFEIWGQLINAATGAEIGSEFRISDMGPDGSTLYKPENPHVVWNSTDNEYLVVWSSDDNSSTIINDDNEIFVQRISNTGAEIGDNDIRISDVGYVNDDQYYDASYPKAAYNSTDNEYLVVWSADDNQGGGAQHEEEIWGQRLSNIAAEIGTNDFRISDAGDIGDNTYIAFHPSVAYNSTNNEYLVVWYADDIDGGVVDDEYEIWGQRLSNICDELGNNDFRISDMGETNNAAYKAYNPDVVYNYTDNEYMVVWKSDDNTSPLVDEEYEVFGQRLTNLCAEIGSNDFRISDMGDDSESNSLIRANYDASKPRIAWNSSSNEYFVTWYGDDNTGFLIEGKNEVFGQKLSNTGAILESEQRISDAGPDGNGSYNANEAALVFGSGNNLIIVWSGDDNQGSVVLGEKEIWGQWLLINQTNNAPRNLFADPENVDNGVTSGTKVSDLWALDMDLDDSYTYTLVTGDGDTDNGSFTISGTDLMANTTFDYAVKSSYNIRVNVNDGTANFAAQLTITVNEPISSLEGDNFTISSVGSVSNAGQDAENADIAYNTNNNQFCVVFSANHNIEGKDEIFAQRVNPADGSKIGSQISISNQVSGNVAFDADDPTVAYNSTDNEYLVVWSSDDNSFSMVDGEYEIFGQRINASTGALLGGYFRISDAGGSGTSASRADNPAIVYNSTDNEYLVVWYADDTDQTGVVDNEKEIFGQRISSAGAELGTNDFRISDMGPDGNSSYRSENPDVEWSSTNNKYLVIWRGQEADNEIKIYGQFLTNAGAETGTNDFLISPASSSADIYDPAIAYNNNDNEFLIVWDADATTPNKSRIYGNRIDCATEALIGNDFLISHKVVGDASYNSYYANVSYNSDKNEYLVVWRGEDNQDGMVDGEVEIFAQRIDNDGSEIDSDVRISQNGGSGNTSFNADNPAAAYSSTSDMTLIVWKGDDNTAPLVDNEYEIFGQLWKSCSDPTVPTVSANLTEICSGSSSTLTISGTLNDATEWEVYTGSCGGTNIGNTATTTFVVSPSNTTTYYIRGEGGCSTPGTCGNVTVTVSPVTAPTATTGSASNISLTSATLNGTINDNCANTTVTFEYGPTAAYGTTVTADQSPVAAATGSTSVSYTVDALLPSTTYHYRIVGLNSVSTTNGPDMTFTTGTPIVIINEVDCNTPGSPDVLEFVELYDGGAGNTSLNGLILVVYNGSDDLSDRTIDLNTYSTDANGYFVLGNAGVSSVDYIFPGNTLQNGADAVALYEDAAGSFPNGTAVTADNVIDALVYDTNDDDDTELLVLLNGGEPQINEDENGDQVNHSMQRISNGSGGFRNTSTYQTLAPTPGSINITTPTVTTTTASSITYNSAESGGNVTNNGDATVYTLGVCWSTSASPTINDNSTDDGSGTGSFTSSITGLNPNTTYYYRAFATNAAGTAYGNESSFETDPPPIIINEVDANSPGTDDLEFIELYDGGIGNLPLDGMVIVFYNGNNDESYRVIDLDGYTTDANGYFLIGNSSVTPSPDITFPDGIMQNGADAVALYDENTFSTGVAVTTTNLQDAIVYDTGQVDDTGLMVLLNASEPQVNEDGAGDQTNHSMQRITNGSGGYRNTSTYQQSLPTAKAANYISTTPTLTTTAASSVTFNSASSGGNITDDGGRSVTSKGVCWSTSSSPTINDNTTTDGGGTGSFTSSITGLNPNTTYYYRAYATNAAGTDYGNELNFTTDANLPTLTTTAASSIINNSTSSGGNVTNDGGATVYTKGVCWSTSSSPTVNDNSTDDGSGTGSFTSSIKDLDPGTLYYVRAFASNSVGRAYGNEISFTTLCINPTDPTGISGTVSICPGGNTNLTRTGGNLNDAPEWRWYTASCGGTYIATGTTINVSPATTTTYYVRAEGGCVTPSNCASVTVTINSETDITSQPASSTTVCEGASNINLSVTATGTGTVTYQWYNSSGILTGETDSNITITTDPANSETYYCIVHSDCGTDVTSNNAIVLINPATEITSQPTASTTVCEGAANINLSVTATGTGTVTYQWYDGSGLISGETASTLTITTVPTNSDTYYCIVHSDCGTDVTSNNAVVLINPATEITNQPIASTTACEGDADIVLSVTGTGTGTVTYQWYNGSGIMSGETGSDLTITTVPANSDTYYCIVSSNCGSNVTSNNAVVTINPATAISSQPAASTTVCQGAANIVLSITGTGTGTVTYLWYNGSGLMSGETGSTLTITTVPANSDTYYCLVGSDCGSDIQSNNAVVLINPETEITNQPVASTTACEGDANIVLSVSAIGGGTISYQWYDGSGLLTGETASTYTITTDPANSETYYCIVSSSCGTDVTSNNAVVLINPATEITVQPTASTTVCQGDANVILSVTGTGTGTVTYQWYDGSGELTGETASALTITTNPSNSETYYCIVSSDCGSNVQSNNAVVLINPSTAITNQPEASTTACEGEPNIVLSVTATGTGTLTYQWYNGSGLMSSETASTLTITTDPANSETYYCIVHSNCGSDVQSDNAVVTINTATVITNQPATSTTVCEGDANIVLSVTATGPGTLTYQWYNSGGILSGENSSTISITTDPDNSETYYCMVGSDCGSDVQSNNAVVLINPATEITDQPEPSTTICEGDPNINLSVTATGTGTITYQWYDSSGPLTGETASNLTISTDPANSDTYYCIVHSDCGSDIQSDNAVVTIQVDTEEPTINCPGDVAVNIDLGNCTAIVYGIAPSGITDNCGTPTVTYALTGATSGTGTNDASGTAFNIGVTTVTYTADDGNGNTNYCSFDITVTDNILPTITCPGNVTQTNDAGLCSAVVNGIAPTAFADNCGTPVLTYSLTGVTTGSGDNDASGTVFNVGETTVEYTVNDGNGNTANCSFTITITDDENPVGITQNITAELDANGNVTITPEQINNASTDNCNIASMSLDITGFNCSNLGPNTVTITIADDAGNIDTETATVTVVDLIAPVFDASADITQCADGGLTTAVVTYPNPTATDNCSSTITINRIAGSASGSAFPVGTSVITYEAVDTQGNRAEISFNIIVQARSIEPSDTDSPEAPFCIETQDQITLNYIGGTLGEGATAHWYSDAVLTNEIGTGNGLGITAPDATTTYYVQFAGTCNTTSAVPLEIVVNPLPVLDITPDFETDYGEETQLEATNDPDYSYLWTPDDQLDDPTIYNPTFTAENSVTITLTVTDENSCVSEANVNIEVILRVELLIYNAITPNGDGKNDTWFIEGITPLNYKIEVRNRAGIIVFESSNYNNDWDGTDKNGKQLQGPYFYTIKIYDSPNLDIQAKKKYTGTISILR